MGGAGGVKLLKWLPVRLLPVTVCYVNVDMGFLVGIGKIAA
jgi:hypothetical protein